MRTARRRATRTCALLAVACAALGAPPAAADSLGPIGFEPTVPPVFTPGTIDNKGGWQSDGSNGTYPCGAHANYDHAVAPTLTYLHTLPGFGAQTLRISNAVTSTCLTDQTLSPSLVNAAGETTADAGGALSGGTRQNVFTAEWQFASTMPLAQQAGLSAVASPERGDGERMSWIQMSDTAAGLQVSFREFVANGAADGNTFVTTPVATALSRMSPHTIRLVIRFVDGTNMDGSENDIVQIFVDGVPVMIGPSTVGRTWENFYREEASVSPRTVDSLLFHTITADGAAAGTSGNGFAIDNVALTSSTTGGNTGVAPQFPAVTPEGTAPTQSGAACSVPRVGTQDNDSLVGTGGGDRLKGKGGNDKLKGRAGDDCLRGGGQRDKLNGGAGKDLLKGGAGDDAIYSFDQEVDRVRCGRGDDRATVDEGDKVKGCEDVL